MKPSKKTQRQFIKFLIIGTANTALDFVIYLLLTRAFEYFEEHYLVAAAISFLIAGGNSYYWNKRWTFRDKTAITKRQLLRFYSASGVGLVVNQFTLWATVQILSATVLGEKYPNNGILDVQSVNYLADHLDLIGKLIASVAAAGVNFAMQKLWTFRPAPESSREQ